MGKNSVTTQGYFVKRLRDNGFITSRVYDRYTDSDRRKWTVVINPEIDSIFITCYDNGEWPYKGMYHIDDGGQRLPSNFYINTMSIEVVIKHLLDFNIDQKDVNIRNNGRPTKQSSSATEKGGQKEGSEEDSKEKDKQVEA